jgi:capsular exopolysaccharide synthesis family protein
MGNGKIESTGSGLVIPGAESVTAESLVGILIHNRGLVFYTTLIFLFVALIYIFQATRVYTSHSRLYVEQSGPRLISEFEGVMTQSKNYLYTQAELVKSAPILSDVVEQDKIKNCKTFYGMDNLSRYLKKNLVVEVGKKDDIINVSFDSPWPQEASMIVNAVVDSYIDYHSTKKQTTVSKLLDILRKEKVLRDRELSEKFYDILEFTRTNGVVSFNEKGGNIVFEELSRLSEALTESQLGTINARADFEAAKTMVDDPEKIKQFAAASSSAGVRISLNDVETQLKGELRDARVTLKSLKHQATESHPAIQAVSEKIELLKDEMKSENKDFSEAYLEVLQLRWKAAQQRQDELVGSFDEKYKQAQDMGVKTTEYSILQSELKRAERICDIIDDRIKELDITENTGALNISILEVARPAETPSKPQKAKIMSLALVFGLMFGCGFALLRDWLDYRLRSAEEISEVLGVPVLGVVPEMALTDSIISSGHKAWKDLKPLILDWLKQGRGIVEKIIKEKKFYPSEILGLIEEARVKPFDEAKMVEKGQMVHLKPKSIAAEAYRTIRTAVFFGVPKAEAKILLVTSPAVGDGKSTLVSNLAIAIAQAGQRILVLDADFRKPMQHKIFQLENKGLSSVLAGQMSLDQAIRPGPMEGIDILCCGHEIPNPSEILNSVAFEEVLRQIAARYDRVIIDSPPVLPVADSQILAALCDITILVLRADKSSRRQSVQACDALLSVGGRILGAIVNDVQVKKNKYGYFSGYGYGYYGRYGYYGQYGYYGNKEQKEPENKYQNV